MAIFVVRNYTNYHLHCHQSQVKKKYIDQVNIRNKKNPLFTLKALLHIVLLTTFSHFYLFFSAFVYQWQKSRGGVIRVCLYSSLGSKQLFTVISLARAF